MSTKGAIAPLRISQAKSLASGLIAVHKVCLADGDPVHLQCDCVCHPVGETGVGQRNGQRNRTWATFVAAWGELKRRRRPFPCTGRVSQAATPAHARHDSLVATLSAREGKDVGHAYAAAKIGDADVVQDQLPILLECVAHL